MIMSISLNASRCQALLGQESEWSLVSSTVVIGAATSLYKLSRGNTEVPIHIPHVYPIPSLLNPTPTTLEQGWGGEGGCCWCGFKVLIIPSAVQVGQLAEAWPPVAEVVVVLVSAA